MLLFFFFYTRFWLPMHTRTHAFASGGKWEAALQLLELMPSEGVTPDLMTYNIALDACVKVRTTAKTEKHHRHRQHRQQQRQRQQGNEQQQQRKLHIGGHAKKGFVSDADSRRSIFTNDGCGWR